MSIEKLKEQLIQFKAVIDLHNPDLIMFGFQENYHWESTISTMLDTILHNINPGKFENLITSSVNKYVTHFNVITAVYKKRTTTIKDANVYIKTNFSSKSNEVAIIKTKGYIIVDVLLDDDVAFSFINCHLPFKSLNITKKAVDLMNEDILNNILNYNNHHMIFLLGDCNSRSLVNIGDRNNPDKLCNGNLKDIDKPEDTTMSDIATDCDDTDAVSCTFNNVNQLLANESELNKYNSDNLLKYLQKRDSWKYCPNVNNLTPFPKHFEEEQITFYPTYKYDPDNNKFKLYKDDAGRFPGYADRIFYLDVQKLNVNILGFQNMEEYQNRNSGCPGDNIPPNVCNNTYYKKYGQKHYCKFFNQLSPRCREDSYDNRRQQLQQIFKS